MHSVSSEIKSLNGVPTLFVNGKAIEGAAYMTYYTHKNRYGDFAGAGYRLFSMPVFFATRTINAVTGIPPFAEGIFENRTPDFSVFDQDVKKILSACPDAYIFPRVNTSLPQWWDDENPDELNDEGFFDIRRPCFSSDKWAEKTKEMIREFICHVEDAPYKDHIIGYQLANGNTEEWISFDLKGSIGKRSRDAFKKFVEESNVESTEAEYYKFLSIVVARRICEFASFIKELLNNRLIVGAFYGYTFELVKRTSCHHALEAVLNCDSVDFICSPVSYAAQRPVMRDHANMTPIDSLKLHNKLYFAENDTRTHLSGPPNDLPYYNSPLWKGPEISVTLDILKMHFSRALCHGHAFWWFDMWGGWYACPEYMKFMASANKVAKESLSKNLKSVSPVAVFVDEDAYKTIPDTNNKAQNICYEFRNTLGRSSVPYDAYLLSDFDKVKDNYKAHIFLVPERTSLLDEAETSNSKYIEINESNFDISPQKLRELLIPLGIKPYFDFDSIIYENKSYLFLHTCETAEYKFDIKLRDAFTKEEINTLTLKGGKSVLMEKL